MSYSITVFTADLDRAIPTTKVFIGERQTLTWAQLVETFVTDRPVVNDLVIPDDADLDARSRDPKFFGPAICGGVFTGDHRKDDKCESMSLLGIDLDYDDQVKVEAAINQAKTLGLTFMWYGSWKPGRARLVFPYKTPVSGLEHRKVYALLMSALGIELDSSCVNPARLFFAPQVPSEERAATHVSGLHDTGRFLSLSAVTTPVDPNSVFAGVRLAGVSVGSQRRTLTLDDLNVLSTTTEKFTEQNRIVFGLAAQAAREGEPLDAFIARVQPLAEAALLANKDKPVKDLQGAREGFEKAARDGHKLGSQERVETQATTQERAQAVARENDADNEEHDAIEALVIKNISQAQRNKIDALIRKHQDKGGSYVEAAVLLGQRYVRGALTVDKLVAHYARLVELSDQHNGDALAVAKFRNAMAGAVPAEAQPRDPWEVPAFMHAKQNQQPRWLLDEASNQWFSRRRDGWAACSFSVVWSEACIEAGRLDLAKETREGLVRSRVFVEPFLCKRVQTLVHQAVPFVFDEDSRVLSECTAQVRQELSPTYSPRVGAYLDALIADKSDRVRLDLWLAAVADLNVELPMLVLVGPRGTGKTKIAGAIARLWESRNVAPAEALLGTRGQGWNSEILTCPLALADEALPVMHGTNFVDADRLKQVVYESRRQINKKGKESATLHGHTRLIVAMNGPSGLKLSPALRSDESTIAALGSRALVLDVQRVENLGFRIDEILDSDEFAEHCLHLLEQLAETIQARRPGVEGGERGRGLAQGYAHFEAWAAEAANDGHTADAIVSLYEHPPSAFDPAAKERCVEDGALWVTAAAVRATRLGRPVTLQQINKDIRSITGEPPVQTVKNGKRARWYLVSRENLERLGCVLQEPSVGANAN